MAEEAFFKSLRKSHMDLNEIYFWTATIHKWQILLNPKTFKEYILTSLKYLSDRNKINVYGFVIMPNHIHLLWEMLEKNGKELPHASFMKFTAHSIVNDLKSRPDVLSNFEVNDPERKHRIWQRDSLAVKVKSKDMFEKVLDYIHLNPLQEHWRLVNIPCEYPWSSANFYLSLKDDFGFLKHYHEVY